jgi:hypothetical protein
LFLFPVFFIFCSWMSWPMTFKGWKELRFPTQLHAFWILDSILHATILPVEIIDNWKPVAPNWYIEPNQRRLEALPGMHCNSLILSISRDAPSLVRLALVVFTTQLQGAVF